MQNRNRDIEIKNKLAVTRGEGEVDNRGKKSQGLQGTDIKDTWTKPKKGRIEGGRLGGRAWAGGSVGGKVETTVLEQQLKKYFKNRYHICGNLFWKT